MGKIANFEIINAKKHYFSFKEICADVGEAEFSALATPLSLHSLRCQKKIVHASKFCAKKMEKNVRFTRGIIDKEKNKVFCEEADRVFVKYSCAGKENSTLCQDKKFTCDYLQSEFARHHKVASAVRVTGAYSGENAISCDYIRGDWDGA